MWLTLIATWVLMSSDAKLTHVEPAWTVSIEHNSGGMDDAAREADALSRRKEATTPWFRRVTEELTLVMLALSKDKAWQLRNVASPEERAKLPRIYEERVEATAAATHEKTGNRRCIYVLRFHPARVSGVIFLELVLNRLPPRSVREALAKEVTERLAKLPEDTLAP
jgi:hypothetical protein